MTTDLQIGGATVDRHTLEAICSRYRVRELAFFGSAARGEMRADSDVDMLVEFLPHSGIDLVDYAALMMELTELVGRRVDLVSKKGLKPLIRTAVIEESHVLYAA
jgi:predicted nucleotidyltransferase